MPSQQVPPWAEALITDDGVRHNPALGNGDMRMRYFGPATPTSTTVEIRRLAHPDFMIEIEAIAVVDN